MRRRRARRGHERSEPLDPVPFDARQTVGGIAGYEAGNGLAHGVIAVIVALAVAILIEPIRRAVRALFRR